MQLAIRETADEDVRASGQLQKDPSYTQKLQLYELFAEVADSYQPCTHSAPQECRANGRDEVDFGPLRLTQLQLTPTPSPLSSRTKRVSHRDVASLSLLQAGLRTEGECLPVEKSFAPLVHPELVPPPLFTSRKKLSVGRTIEEDHGKSKACAALDPRQRKLLLNDPALRKPVPSHRPRAPRKHPQSRCQLHLPPAPAFSLPRNSTASGTQTPRNVGNTKVQTGSRRVSDTAQSPKISSTTTMPPKARSPSGRLDSDFSTKPSKKSRPRKTAWDDEAKLFSAGTKLKDVDLHTYFTKPEAWSTLSEGDKAKVRSLLPSDLQYSPEGAPSTDFLRYDPDWRFAVRLFQEDLIAGRYEPAWLLEAEQASAERAAGNFDEWKENEFEKFWGQKQAFNTRATAGDSANVRLDTMIRAGLFQIGDVWSYYRKFGQDKDAPMIEKDIVIKHIPNDFEIEFLIPAAEQRTVYSSPENRVLTYGLQLNGDMTKLKMQKSKNVATRSMRQQKRSVSESIGMASQRAKKSDPPTTKKEDEPRPEPKRLKSKKLSTIKKVFSKKENEFAVVSCGSFNHCDESDSALSSLSSSPSLTESLKNYMEIEEQRIISLPKVAAPSVVNVAAPLPALPESPPVTTKPGSFLSSSLHDDSLIYRQAPSSFDSHCSTSLVKVEPMSSIEQPPVTATRTDDNLLEPVIVRVSNVSKLESKIIEIDGHVDPKVKNANSWKTFRCSRNNQYMGMLWEIRESFYVHHVAEVGKDEKDGKKDDDKIKY